MYVCASEEICSSSLLTSSVVCIPAWSKVSRKLQDTNGLGVVGWGYLSSHTSMHSLNHCPKWQYCNVLGSSPFRN